MNLPLPTGYDAEIAKRLCFLSDLAYDCFIDEEENPGGSTIEENFAFIIRQEDGKTLLTFQGSNDIVDFLDIDARCAITEPENEPTFPPVHAGFWRAADRLIEPLREELSKGLHTVLYLSGHSLGYGIAEIMAVRLREMGYNVAAVYGFGGPPVGAVKFYNYRNKFSYPTYLLAYRRDGVPYLQPKGVHVAPITHLDERAYVTAGRPGFAWLNPFRWSAWRDDHDSQNYVAATCKIADRVAL